MADADLFIGVDLGTSGCRAIAINRDGRPQAERRSAMEAPDRHGPRCEQGAHIWWKAVRDTLWQLCQDLGERRADIRSLAVDGTSGTLLLTNAAGTPLGPALMYNDGRSQQEALRISAVAPKESAAHGATSTLAKLLHLTPHTEASHALHQADWIVGMLSGHFGISDANNSLKLGFDAIDHRWPDWLDELGVQRSLLPAVVHPGTDIGQIRASIAADLGLPETTRIIAGTTDSTAAFIATGVDQTGEAVTSLGSTLVMKVISDRPIFSPQHGVYAQPLHTSAGQKWLVGGGSNSGGAVLQHFFSSEQMAAMTPSLNPGQPTGLDYYPLLCEGERFPVADPTLQPRLEPRPNDDVQFFQGLLEAMARIEHQGYTLLAELGAPYPTRIRSAGGGSRNPAWTRIRQLYLGVPFVDPIHQEAAYGSALLARRGFLELGS